MKLSLQTAETIDDAAAAPAAGEDFIAPAPRVSVQAFCATVETAASGWKRVARLEGLA